MFPFPRACNAIFTALEQSQEAIEITSEDQVIQVRLERILLFSSMELSHTKRTGHYLGIP